jgi:hypothetical protein
MDRISIVVFLISLIFSILAGIMAFLITYQEYEHHYLDKRDFLKASLRTGGVTFIFFLSLGFILAMTMPYFLK